MESVRGDRMAIKRRGGGGGGCGQGRNEGMFGREGGGRGVVITAGGCKGRRNEKRQSESEKKENVRWIDFLLKPDMAHSG